jgi:hypothetical protein
MLWPKSLSASAEAHVDIGAIDVLLLVSTSSLHAGSHETLPVLLLISCSGVLGAHFDIFVIVVLSLAGRRFGPKPLLTAEVVKKIKELRKDGLTVPEIMRRMMLSKASIYRALP